jgi:hypothetical protein
MNAVSRVALSPLTDGEACMLCSRSLWIRSFIELASYADRESCGILDFPSQIFNSAPIRLKKFLTRCPFQVTLFGLASAMIRQKMDGFDTVKSGQMFCQGLQ